MKHLLYNMSIVFVVSFLLMGCDKEDTSQSCRETTTTRNRSVNFFDLRSSSPFFNQVVANFKFTQLSKTYSGSSTCPLIDCSTLLSIQNNSNKKISFDYNITFGLNFAQWNYQGVAVINPRASIEIGQINSSCAAIDLGALFIQSASITYQ